MEERLWHKSYAPGVKKSLDYEKVTLSQALTRSSQEFPEKTALNYMGKRITYRQLNRLANRFARALLELGIKPGTKSPSACRISPRLLSPIWPSFASAQWPFRTILCTLKESWNISLTIPIPRW